MVPPGLDRALSSDLRLGGKFKRTCLLLTWGNIEFQAATNISGRGAPLETGLLIGSTWFLAHTLSAPRGLVICILED